MSQNVTHTTAFPCSVNRLFACVTYGNTCCTRDLRRFEIQFELDYSDYIRFESDGLIFESAAHAVIPQTTLTVQQKLQPLRRCNWDLFYVYDFSETSLLYVWLMLWQIRPSVVCLSSVTCVHPTQGFNFSEIFLHHIIAWQPGNSPTKNHEDRPRGSPPPSKSP